MAKNSKSQKVLGRKKLIEKIGDKLDREFPDAKCALDFQKPEQLLFATILSAQCTDVRVNMVTPTLFNRYPEVEDLAKAELKEVEKIIHSTGFYHNKAKNLIACAAALVRDHSARLPDRLEELVKLPGVGRKTANVVLGEIFQKAEGIVVDTHVGRISQLLGLTDNVDPIKIERDLMEIVPYKWWVRFSHWLILLGRSRCIARRPKCGDCILQKDCEYGKKQIE